MMASDVWKKIIICCHTTLCVKANLKQRSMVEPPPHLPALCYVIRALNRLTPSGCGRRSPLVYTNAVCLCPSAVKKSRQNDQIDKMASVKITYTTFKQFS